MAHPAIAYTLSTILLTIIVVVLEVPASSATYNPNSLVIQSASQIESTALPDGYVAYPFIEAAYKVHLENATWIEAKERCISEGAHLAVIDTYIKLGSLLMDQILWDHLSQSAGYWVGIHNLYDDTLWLSATTGSTLRRLPWAPDQPSRWHDCVMVWIGKGRGLVNYPCTGISYHYVCEISIPGNYNGCKDYPTYNLSSTVIQSRSQFELTALPDGYVAYPYIEAAYKVYLENATWLEAKERCISEGAHLAVIDTHIKFGSLMNQTGWGQPSGFWVGIHSIYDDTTWISATTGLTLQRIPWAPNYPQNYNDCVVAWTGKPRGLLNQQCYYNYHYVCEIPIPGNYNECKDYPTAEIPFN